MFPLLVTSVIKTHATRSNALTSQSARLDQTKDAVRKIANAGIFSKIVIVDGSETSIFDEEEISSFSRSGVDIEQLLFQQDYLGVEQYGKSFGENQISNFGIENSRLISVDGGFFKLSGRYYIENLGAIVSKTEGSSNFFYFDNPPFLNLGGRFVSTVFYKCTTRFFAANFAGVADECSYEPDGYLEAIYYRRLARLQRTGVRAPFPRYAGISGTTGAPLVNRYFHVRNLASQLGGLCYAFDDPA